MRKVYITKGNFYRITSDNEMNGANQSQLNGGSEKKKNVYKKDVYFLNRLEEDQLRSQLDFLTDPIKYLREYRKREKKDRFKYVYESNKSSYHADKNCPRLTSKFTNFTLPGEIKEKGKEEIQRFRKWFKENEELLTRKPDLFAAKLQIAFGLSSVPRIVEFENTGVTEMENLNLGDLENRIDEVLRATGRFYRDNPDKQTLIKRFQKLTFLAYKDDSILDKSNPRDKEINLTDKELKSFLEEYDVKFKKPFKELLLQYYMVKYNPDLEFDGELLAQLGFESCGSCCSA